MGVFINAKDCPFKPFFSPGDLWITFISIISAFSSHVSSDSCLSLHTSNQKLLFRVSCLRECVFTVSAILNANLHTNALTVPGGAWGGSDRRGRWWCL